MEVCMPKSTPRLCSASLAKPHYRRRATCKAPRKRTFIANMTKYSGKDMSAHAMVGASARADAEVAAMISSCCLGGDDNGKNGGSPPPRVTRLSFGGDGDNGDSMGRMGRGVLGLILATEPATRALLIGSAALLATFLGVPPAPSSATEGSSKGFARPQGSAITVPARKPSKADTASLSGSAHSSGSGSLSGFSLAGPASGASSLAGSPTSLCLNYPPGLAQDPARQRRVSNTSTDEFIPYGKVDLTAQERKMYFRECNQLHFRDTYRV